MSWVSYADDIILGVIYFIIEFLECYIISAIYAFVQYLYTLLTDFMYPNDRTLLLHIIHHTQQTRR